MKSLLSSVSSLEQLLRTFQAAGFSGYMLINLTESDTFSFLHQNYHTTLQKIVAKNN